MSQPTETTSTPPSSARPAVTEDANESLSKDDGSIRSERSGDEPTRASATLERSNGSGRTRDGEAGSAAPTTRRTGSSTSGDIPALANDQQEQAFFRDGEFGTYAGGPLEFADADESGRPSKYSVPPPTTSQRLTSFATVAITGVVVLGVVFTLAAKWDDAERQAAVSGAAGDVETAEPPGPTSERDITGEVAAAEPPTATPSAEAAGATDPAGVDRAPDKEEPTQEPAEHPAAAATTEETPPVEVKAVPTPKEPTPKVQSAPASPKPAPKAAPKAAPKRAVRAPAPSKPKPPPPPDKQSGAKKPKAPAASFLGN